MITMYGAKILGSKGAVEFKSATSGAAIAVGDLVTFKTDGQIEPTTTGDVIAGVALEAASGSGSTVRFVAGEGLRVLMDNDNTGTTFASTHVGGRFDMTGTTGAQVVDTSTVAQVGDGTDTGQLLCLEYNPQGHGYDSDTSIGLFEVAEVQ